MKFAKEISGKEKRNKARREILSSKVRKLVDAILLLQTLKKAFTGS